MKRARVTENMRRRRLTESRSGSGLTLEDLLSNLLSQSQWVEIKDDYTNDFITDGMASAVLRHKNKNGVWDYIDHIVTGLKINGNTLIIWVE